MTTHTAARAFLLAVVVVGAFGAIGTGTSLAYFSDSATGDGTFSATSDLCTESPESVDHAFNDSNANGCYDQGEDTYDHSELDDFDEPGANLVIPEGSDPIDLVGQEDISIAAGNITSEVDLSTNTGDISLEANNGGIDVGGTGVNIEGGQGQINITAAHDINISDATVTTQTGSISVSTSEHLVIDGATLETGGQGDVELTARSISARSSLVESNTGDVLLSALANAGGEINATQASITVGDGNGDLNFESNGDAIFDDATLSATGQAFEVNLSDPTATLHVDGTTIENGPLSYTPGDVTVDPESRDGDDVEGQN